MRAVIGVISDTHGLMRPEALRGLAGADLILHAGDVGKPEVLDALGRIAPVRAVRGNVDRGAWAEALPRDAVAEVAGARIYLLHDIAGLCLDPAAAGMRAVVYGHSHQAAREVRGGVLFLNPGSAGPRRFRLPVTMARIIVDGGTVRAETMDLDVTQT